MERIGFIGWGAEITNRNTQIPNNIQITESNVQNIMIPNGYLA
jgi:hypothetical protein